MMTPANYGTRAIAYLIDIAFAVIPGLVAVILGIGGVFSDAIRGIGIILIVVGVLWMLTAWFYNDVWRQGRTGSTFGKQRMGISLVNSTSGRPIGVGFALIRWGAVWFFNSLSFGLYLLADLLAPAFTERRQRITDKMLSAEVVVGVARNGETTLPPPVPPPGGQYSW